MFALFCALFSLASAQNLASWIPLSASSDSIVVPPASNLGVFKANAIATQRLHNRFPDKVSSPNDTVLIINGGYDYTNGYALRFQDIWGMVQTAETGYSWFIIAVNDGSIPWPTSISDGHDWRQLASGDFMRCFGADYTNYFNGLWVFDTLLWKWINVLPELAPGSPLRRSWGYMVPLGPTGNGIDERFMIYGGNGAFLTDTLYDEDDKDLDDAHILTIGKNASGVYHTRWEDIYLGTCGDLQTTCTDSTVPSSQFVTISATFADLANRFDGAVRPANWTKNIAEMINDLDSVRAYLVNVTGTEGPNGNVNDDATCTTFCDTPNFPPNYPGKRSATRMAYYNQKVYLFGGYSCEQNGLIGKGGEVCMDNGVYVYDLVYQNWTAIHHDDASDEQQSLWPKGRSYHMAQPHGNKMWILDGAYLDEVGTYEYFNDVNVFNMDTMLWEPADVRGVPPSKRWDASGWIDGDNIWFMYGVSASTLHDDVWILGIGRSVEAENIFSTVSTAVAGTSTTFLAQARHSTLTENGTVVWGDPIIWGVGLSSLFEVSVVETEAPSPANGLFAPSTRLNNFDVTEIGGGVYNITFTATLSPTAAVFVLYNKQNIPGSPFTVSVAASATSSGSLSYLTQTIDSAVRSDLNVILLQLCDVYGNPTVGNTTTIVTLATGLDGSNPIDSTTILLPSGLYQISYVSPDVSAFDLTIKVNDAAISGSPFAIRTYSELGVKHSARVAVVVIAAFAQAIILVLSYLVYKYRREVAFRSATPLFIQFMFLGALLALCSVYAFATQSDAACRAFPIILGLAYMITLSALYIKTWRLMVIFRQKEMKIIAISLLRMSTYVLVIVIGEAAFNIAWLIGNPPTLQIIQGDPSPLSYQECGGTNYNIWQLASFAYKGVYLFYGIFLAYMTRRLPVAFNESAWIGLSIYNVAVCVMIVLPVVYGGKTQDNLTSIFVITCAAIIWAVLFMVIALTGPKLYLVLQPHPDPRIGDQGDGTHSNDVEHTPVKHFSRTDDSHLGPTQQDTTTTKSGGTNNGGGGGGGGGGGSNGNGNGANSAQSGSKSDTVDGSPTTSPTTPAHVIDSILVLQVGQVYQKGENYSDESTRPNAIANANANANGGTAAAAAGAASTGGGGAGRHHHDKPEHGTLAAGGGGGGVTAVELTTPGHN